MPRQTSVQLTEATERQIAALKAQGHGSTTDIIRIAIDRMYQVELMSQLTPYQIGEIAAIIGKRRETVDPESIAGYDAKRQAMAEDRERKAERMAEYNRLRAEGMSDQEIERMWNNAP